MRILFTVPRYHPNHDGMVAGLLGAGPAVSFLVRTVAPAEKHRVPVTLVPDARRTPLRFLAAYLRATRPDVVVARNPDRVNYAIFLASRPLGIRYLLYVQHPGGYENLDRWRRVRLALGLWPAHTINSRAAAPAAEVAGKTFDFLPFAVEPGPAKTAYPTKAPVRVLAVGKLDQER